MVALLWLSSPLQAVTVVIKDATPAGDSPSVRDTPLRSDGEFQGVPFTDFNFGLATGEPASGVRLYPDVGYDPTKGPRHTMFWFDVSGIPTDATINSATLSVYFVNNGVGGNTGDYKLSRFKEPWIEGLGPVPPTNPGEPTWNSRQHNMTLWAVAGATGLADIYPDNITFDAGPASDHWEEITVTDWIQDWVDGTESNHGVIIWGGANMSGYFGICMSEYPDTNLRPKLTVTYNQQSEPGVSIDLGDPNIEDGMSCPNQGDGKNTPVTIGEVECRQNTSPAEDFYMYFQVSDTYAYQGSRPEVDITINYYDTGTGTLEMQYDSPGNELTDKYKEDGSITLTNTNTWKQHVYTITDAYFGNRQNYGSDFRIFGGVGNIFYLDVVEVVGQGPGGQAPVIVEVAPDPDTAYEDVEYIRQLTLLQGDPPVSWSVVQAPPGTQVSSGGLVSGWTPGADDVDQTFDFQIEAENAYGSDTESWQVLVQAGSGLLLNDPLQGSTIGTRVGGSFVSGGWRVDNQYDCIYWHVPHTNKMAFEYNVTGIGDSCSGGIGKNELSHMYDWTFGNADIVYSGGYRDDPYKQYIRKQCYSPKERTLEILWRLLTCGHSDDSAALTWNSGTTYTFRCQWENTDTDSIMKIYRNGTLIKNQSCPGSWNPGGLSLRIAASPRRANEGAHVGAIYSNVKLYNLEAIPPKIEEVVPDPQHTFVGKPYSQQLVLLEGIPPITWSVVGGPAGLQVDGNGFVDNWTPQGSDVGHANTIAIRAGNAYGYDLESWQVIVHYFGDHDDDLDVDLEDFGDFQACLSGAGTDLEPGCENFDFNSDNDVDQDDFVAFQACMSGANQSPGC